MIDDDDDDYYCEVQTLFSIATTALADIHEDGLLLNSRIS